MTALYSEYPCDSLNKVSQAGISFNVYMVQLTFLKSENMLEPASGVLSFGTISVEPIVPFSVCTFKRQFIKSYEIKITRAKY